MVNYTLSCLFARIWSRSQHILGRFSVNSRADADWYSYSHLWTNERFQCKQPACVWKTCKRYVVKMCMYCTLPAELPCHLLPCAVIQHFEICQCNKYCNYSKMILKSPQRRTATRLMAWLALWLWRIITFRGNLLFIWIEKPINSAALQSDNVIMALATQDKQIVLL